MSKKTVIANVKRALTKVIFRELLSRAAGEKKVNQERDGKSFWGRWKRGSLYL